MAHKLKAAVGAAALLLGSQAMAQITLYEGENFRGRGITIDRQIGNLNRADFNNSAGSVIVERGRWEVCERPRFEGRCALLRRGNYDSLRGTGLEWNISSIRPVEREGRRYDAVPQASANAQLYEYRVRPNERLYTVPVNWTRAVVAQGSQRCWVERQAVPTQQTNVGGAIAGAVIGGILGHQVGGGSGRDAATALGAIAGAAVGNNAMGASGGVATQDVQRCTSEVNTTPAFYEVSYNFRGAEHRAQLSTPPGPQLTVNERGEPRM